MCMARDLRTLCQDGRLRNKKVGLMQRISPTFLKNRRENMRQLRILLIAMVLLLLGAMPAMPAMEETTRTLSMSRRP